MKTKKRKIGKKIPQNKAIEEKLMIAWETPKLIASLPYSNCEELEEFDWSNEFWTKICPIKYKTAETEDQVWYSNGTIEDLVYENALLQNVEFEWGTFSRAVQVRPTLRGKDIDPPVIKTAKIIKVFNENLKDIAEVVYENCTVIPKTYLVQRVDIRTCQVEQNFIYKNTKYFCRSCSFDICNDCFTNCCSAHDVQWLGIATFNCLSPHHKPDPKCL